MAFSLPIFTSRLFSRLMKHADHLILSFFVPIRELGLYSILHKTAFALIEIPSSLMEVLGPLISRSSSQDDRSQLERQVQVASKWIFSLCFPVILFILLHPDALLRVLGDQFAAGTMSFVILCIGAFFAFSSGPIALTLTMSGRPTITMLNTIGLGITSLALYALFIPSFGVLGAAISFAASTAAVSVARFVETLWLLRVRPWSKEFLKPLAASVAAMIPTLMLEPLFPANKYLSFGLALSLYLLAYLAILLLLGLDVEDRFILSKVRERLLQQPRQEEA
jgi:O-antigen/teichoic acid export membrane protein